MSNLTFWDHAFALIVFLAYPVYAKVTIRPALDDILERGEVARISQYKEVILTWMVFAICVFAMWVLFDRNWTDLGIRLPDPVPLAGGLAVAALVILIFVVPLRNMSRSSQRSAEFGPQMGDIALLMPRSKAEEYWFKAVSTNAGITEELIFRGYLIWYLEHFLGLWWAAGIAIFMFGFAHMYQGLKLLPGILLISAVTVCLYVYTGSLVVPVLFHIFLDAIQGHYIARILRLAESSA